MEDHVGSLHERTVVGDAAFVPVAKGPSERPRRHGTGRGAIRRFDFGDFSTEIGEETTAKLAHLDRAVEDA
jgi:hypothetical protein